MAIISCPHCHQLVDREAISCPYCRTTLKAYGHPGIPLHRATGEDSLCDSCTYHADNTCNFPQRPYAKECTLYDNLADTQLRLETQRQASSWTGTMKSWSQRHQSWLLLAGLLCVCLLIALSG